MKAKIVRFLTYLNVEDGINSKDAAFAQNGALIFIQNQRNSSSCNWAIVIECYQIIGNNIAYRPLYGHLKNIFSLGGIFFLDRLSKIIFFLLKKNPTKEEKEEN